MSKQYLAEFRHNEYKSDTWFNIKPRVGGTGRYYKTLEEAKMACKMIYKVFPDRAHTDYMPAGLLGNVEMVVTAEEAHRMAVAETRIRMRLVTEWSVVE